MLGMFVESSNQHYSEQAADPAGPQAPEEKVQPQSSFEPKESAKSTSTGSKRRRGVRTAGENDRGELSLQESQRRERNKQAAKRSRARNKERYDRLEERQLELQRELFLKRQELAQAKLELQKILAKNTLVINLLIQPNSLNVGKQMTYSRLEELTQDGECIDEDQVNLILDTLKLKIGATCKERQNMIDYYFKQWIHLSYPALHRFLMWTAELGRQDFGEEPIEWAREFQKELNFTTQQKSFISTTRDLFVSSKNILTGYIDQIHVTKHRLEIEGEKLEHILDELRLVITPHQSAQMVLFCEKNKYKQEMHLWSERNLVEPVCETYEEPPSRKRTKK